MKMKIEHIVFMIKFQYFQHIELQLHEDPGITSFTFTIFRFHSGHSCSQKWA